MTPEEMTDKFNPTKIVQEKTFIIDQDEVIHGICYQNGKQCFLAFTNMTTGHTDITDVTEPWNKETAYDFIKQVETMMSDYVQRYVSHG